MSHSSVGRNIKSAPRLTILHTNPVWWDYAILNIFFLNVFAVTNCDEWSRRLQTSPPYCAPEIFISLLKFPWCLPKPGHIKHESICCKNTETLTWLAMFHPVFLPPRHHTAVSLAKIIQIFSRSDNLYELFISDFLPSYSYSINSLSFSDTVKC